MALETLRVPAGTPQYSKVGNKYVLSKKAVKRMGSRFNIPMFTAAALGLTLYHPIAAINENRNWEGVQSAARIMLRNFTGIHFKVDGTTQFNWRWMGSGLLPFALVMAVNKSGIFRSTNARLARQKIPLRFS